MGCCIGKGTSHSKYVLRKQKTQIFRRYHIDNKAELLGAGAYGKVILSHNLADPSIKVAIKVMAKAAIGYNIANI